MKLLAVTLYAVLLGAKWIGTDCREVEDFTDAGMSNTIENYDGQPY